MTIDAIRLQNFMAFEDTDWVDLRPITLLFGRNSSGKSVLIRALLLLRQSVQQARNGEVFVFSSMHSVDIGGFREMAHNGKEDAIVRFHFRCTSREIEDILAKSRHPDIKRRATSTLQIALGYAAERQEEKINLQKLNLSDLEIYAVSTEERVPTAAPSAGSEIDLEIYAVSTEEREGDLLFRTVLLNEEDARRFGEDWYVDGLLTSIEENKTWNGFACWVERGFLDIEFTKPANSNPIGYEILKRLFSELSREIHSFLNQIVHLGPVRPEPQRRYSFSQADVAEWRARGWEAFLDFISGRMGKTATQILEINGWLKRLELAEGTEPRPTSEEGSLYTEFEVAIREREGMQPLPLSAMGFGLSQVLPIVVQCVAAQPGSLVIIEQPELHLHPRAQAALADLFIAAFKEKPDPEKESQSEQEPRYKQRLRFLIETHSEHLLLRMRRRIAETSALRRESKDSRDPIPSELWLNNRDLDFLFVYREEGQTISQIVKIGIDERGEFDASRTPKQFDDFFADDLIELAALVRA